MSVRTRTVGFAAERPATVLLVVVLLVAILVGGAGEAVAHNPAGHAVPGCENGAEVVAHRNPGCHG